MAKFVLLFGGEEMPEGEEAQKAVMDGWMSWFAELGPSIVDPGSPLGPATTIASDGSASDGGVANPPTGYTVIAAEDMNDAASKAKSCPGLARGGWIQLYEALRMD